MHVFRIFFVSTVLIPVIVVALTSDDNGLRIRRPRNIIISEDATRRATKNINSTSSNNGKTSVAASRKRVDDKSLSKSKSSPTQKTFSLHNRHLQPLKLEVRNVTKSIKNSTRSDLANYMDYIISNVDEIGTGRDEAITFAVVVSWIVYYAFRAIVSVIFWNIGGKIWNYFKHKYGIGNDYIEYFIKFGTDNKHPFGDYGGGWNPQFGIALKTKDEHQYHGSNIGWNNAGPNDDYPGHHPGWNGWPPPQNQASHGWNGWHHEPQHHQASNYHYQHHHPGHDFGYGWPSKHKTESEEEEDNLRHKFDKEKGWKYAQKYAKKYGKKAHKYGLRPSKYSYLFDEDGNIILGGKSQGYAWHRRKRSVNEVLRYNQNLFVQTVRTNNGTK